METHHQAAPQPPQPVHKFLSVETRRAACTHLTVARMFDTFSPHKCMLCHRVPRNGYVWWCTQDHGGWLPQAEYMTLPNPAWRVSNEVIPGEDVDLKDWMVKAIAEGHYTPDQIRLIKQQRRNVHDTINALEKAYAASTLDNSASTSSTITDDVISLPPLAPNPYLPLITIDETYRQDDGHMTELQTLPSAEHNPESLPFSPSNSDIKSIPEFTVKSIKKPRPAKNPRPQPPPQGLGLAMFPICNFRACANCRPMYKDRAWSAIEDTMPTSPPFPPTYEIENRRLSNQTIVAKLGSGPPATPAYYRSWSELGIVYSHHSESNFLTRQNSNWIGVVDDTDDFETDERARKSLRASLKKAFKNVMSVHKRDSSRTSRSTSRSKRSSRKVRRQEEDAEEGDLGLALQTVRAKLEVDRITDPETVLEDASGTPLPGSDGRTETTEIEHDFEEGEVDVDDGVAVTEEALGTGSADIIMRV
jgi:hypothetical protein